MFWRSKAKYSAYRQQYCIVVLRLAKRLDLNYLHHEKKNDCDCHDSSANYCYNGNHITVYKCIKST